MKKVSELTGFILGIISLVLLILIPGPGLILSIVGLIFGKIQLKENSKLNTAGIIINITSIALHIILIISMVIFFSSVKPPNNNEIMFNPKGLITTPSQNNPPGIVTTPGLPPNSKNPQNLPPSIPTNIP